MKTEANSRQIPKTVEYTTDKKYNDLLYSYLQCKSEPGEGGVRFIKKSDINFSKIGDDLNISRQTISKRFKNLLQLELIVLKEDVYELTKLEPYLASLVPYKTLKLLVDVFNDYSISLFVYLLNRYIAEEEKPFITTMAQMKGHIGIATSTTSNNDTVSNILMVLKSVGLIEYHLKHEVDRSLLIIDCVRNVPKMC